MFPLPPFFFSLTATHSFSGRIICIDAPPLTQAKRRRHTSRRRRRSNLVGQTWRTPLFGMNSSYGSTNVLSIPPRSSPDSHFPSFFLFSFILSLPYTSHHKLYTSVSCAISGLVEREQTSQVYERDRRLDLAIARDWLTHHHHHHHCEPMMTTSHSNEYTLKCTV